MTTDRRAQIVAAARALLDEDPRASLAVRSVAERAGIGASTLRHYFPSQSSLHEAVYEQLANATIDDLRIHDATAPAEARLRECLVQLLPPAQRSEVPWEGWLEAIQAVFGPTGSPDARAAWGAYVVAARQAIARWLRTLASEGVRLAVDEDRGARSLLIVIDGLMVGRMLPPGRLSPDDEMTVLDDAIAAVLAR